MEQTIRRIQSPYRTGNKKNESNVKLLKYWSKFVMQTIISAVIFIGCIRVICYWRDRPVRVLDLLQVLFHYLSLTFYNYYIINLLLFQIVICKWALHHAHIKEYICPFKQCNNTVKNNVSGIFIGNCNTNINTTPGSNHYSQ